MTLPHAPENIGNTRISSTLADVDKPAFPQPSQNGDALANPPTRNDLAYKNPKAAAKPWAHFVAGGYVPTFQDKNLEK